MHKREKYFVYIIQSFIEDSLRSYKLFLNNEKIPEQTVSARGLPHRPRCSMERTRDILRPAASDLYKVNKISISNFLWTVKMFTGVDCV